MTTSEVLSTSKIISWVIFVVISNVHASRILFLAPVSSKSHNNFYLPIAEELAERGHEIGYLSPYKFGKNFTKEVVLADMPWSKLAILDRFKDTNKLMKTWNGAFHYLREGPAFCFEALAKKEAQDLLQEKWDVVVVSVFFNDCFLYDVNRMKVPFILMIPNSLFEPFSHLSGTPQFPSFMHNPSNPVVTGPPPYTLLQRTINVLVDVFGRALFEYYYLPRVDSFCHSRGQCTEDDPTVRDIRLNSSLVIINSIRSTELSAVPYPPTVVHAGGIHLKDPKPLPQDLEEWVNSSGDSGFIYFSLGSVVRTEHMPQHIFDILVKVFSSLPQRVLWKWDADPPKDLPQNIRMGKWLPQQDLLGHPLVQLFITHGGLHSTMEAAHHGVPLLGMPVFGDQKSNMIQVESSGMGRVLMWEDITEVHLLKLIQDIISDKNMKKAIFKRSALMHDLPVSSKDNAAFWVEYIIRHNGAPHLKSPVIKMPWYRLYNVDVWAALFLFINLLLFIIYKTLRTCLQCMFRSKKIKSE